MTAGISPRTILDRAQELRAGIVSFRRRIHANPELSFREHKTAKLIAGALKFYGYEVQENFGGTGVVGTIAGKGWKGPYVGIRADMDALPIEEANKCEYQSDNNGVMHACGHDAHVACALGAAKLIADALASDEFNGGVRLIFQPAEETVNEQGKSGATLMVESGVLTNVSCLLALHVFPGLPCGHVGLRKGTLLAACDSFSIKVKGRGCHGAYPELGVDAVVIASQLVQALQTITSRRKPAVDAAVLTIGGIRSSSFAPNVVADEVDVVGTVRYFRPEIHDLFASEIANTCRMVEQMGGSFELQYKGETPALRNDTSVADTVADIVNSMLGANHLVQLGQQLGADDFSFYTAHVPSCYFALGTALSDRDTELHSPTFDINEDALPIGAALLAASAVNLQNLSP